MNSKQARLNRARKTRVRIALQKKNRLVVHRTNQHIYAQLIAATGDRVLAQASTLNKEFKEKNQGKNNLECAKAVGEMIAGLALELGIKEVAFDRSGFKYHGRIAELAESARNHGLVF